MSYRVYTAGQLQDFAAAGGETKLFRDAGDRYWLNQVTKDHDVVLVAEVHDAEADIYVVVDGEADLHLGGTLVNPISPLDGQHRGSGLTGATCHHIAAGDLIVIPAGVPHLVDARQSHLVYLVIKEKVG